MYTLPPVRITTAPERPRRTPKTTLAARPVSPLRGMAGTGVMGATLALVAGLGFTMSAALKSALAPALAVPGKSPCLLRWGGNSAAGTSPRCRCCLRSMPDLPLLRDTSAFQASGRRGSAADEPFVAQDPAISSASRAASVHAACGAAQLCALLVSWAALARQEIFRWFAAEILIYSFFVRELKVWLGLSPTAHVGALARTIKGARK